MVFVFRDLPDLVGQRGQSLVIGVAGRLHTLGQDELNRLRVSSMIWSAKPCFVAP